MQAFNFNVDLAIPLVVKVHQNQPLRFRIFDIQNFDVSQPIFLHDIENDIYVDLRQQNYDINIEAGNYTNRFEITFKENNILNNSEIETSSLNVTQDNISSQLIISNPKNLKLNQVSIFDVSGKQIFDNSINLPSCLEIIF